MGEAEVRKLVLNLIVVLMLTAVVTTSIAQKPRRRIVSAQVTMSVEEYDPATTCKGLLRCEVRNDSPYPWRVPIGFDGGYVKVQSGGLSLRRVTKDKDNVRLAWLEPGEQ